MHGLMMDMPPLLPGLIDFERRIDCRMKPGRAIFGVKTRTVDGEGKAHASQQ
jgi:hypothetical protein